MHYLCVSNFSAYIENADFPVFLTILFSGFSGLFYQRSSLIAIDFLAIAFRHVPKRLFFSLLPSSFFLLFSAFFFFLLPSSSSLCLFLLLIYILAATLNTIWGPVLQFFFFKYNYVRLAFFLIYVQVSKVLEELVPGINGHFCSSKEDTKPSHRLLSRCVAIL